MAKRKTPKALKIYQINFDRPAVDAMPADARRMFFLLGHIGNDLNTQYRLLVMSLQPSRNRAVAKFAEARLASVLRNFIGITFEGLRAVQRSFLGTPLGKSYVAHLTPEGADALRRVRKQLGQMGLLAKLRNSYSYHLPKPHLIDQAYKKIPADLNLSMLSGDPRHSSLYEMSNLMMTSGMLALVPNASDEREAMSQIAADVLGKAKDLMDLLEHIMITIALQHQLATQNPTKVATIRSAKSVTRFKIPPVLSS